MSWVLFKVTRLFCFVFVCFCTYDVKLWNRSIESHCILRADVTSSTSGYSLIERCRMRHCVRYEASSWAEGVRVAVAETVVAVTDFDRPACRVAIRMEPAVVGRV